ncbi:MAG: radical SAM protein, partial [Desulfobulbaceae bacterium]|nr:radical SAM protein [Desulfobulbaceae bacterium]
MRKRHPDGTPSLVFANSRGEILDYDGLKMAGSSAGKYCRPKAKELIELPEGSELFVLPGRLPIGSEPGTREPALLDSNPYAPGDEIQAVAAFMAPAHTAIYTSAYQKRDRTAPLLPLFAYTAVGWYQEKFWVAAFRSDADRRQDVRQFDQQLINKKTAK